MSILRRTSHLDDAAFAELWTNALADGTTIADQPHLQECAECRLRFDVAPNGYDDSGEQQSFCGFAGRGKKQPPRAADGGSKGYSSQAARRSEASRRISQIGVREEGASRCVPHIRHRAGAGSE